MWLNLWLKSGSNVTSNKAHHRCRLRNIFWLDATPISRSLCPSSSCYLQRSRAIPGHCWGLFRRIDSSTASQVTSGRRVWWRNVSDVRLVAAPPLSEPLWSSGRKSTLAYRSSSSQSGLVRWNMSLPLLPAFLSWSSRDWSTDEAAPRDLQCSFSRIVSWATFLVCSFGFRIFPSTLAARPRHALQRSLSRSCRCCFLRSSDKRRMILKWSLGVVDETSSFDLKETLRSVFCFIRLWNKFTFIRGRWRPRVFLESLTIPASIIRPTWALWTVTVACLHRWLLTRVVLVSTVVVVNFFICW